MTASDFGYAFGCIALKHVLWMLLVGMFGNWGTSIRSGWIEDCKGAAAFIRANVREAEENDERADA